MIRSAAFLCAGALAIVSPFLGILPGWTPALATTTALTALSLVGLNLIFGVVGMLAFGQAAFMVIPAYAASLLERVGVPTGWSVLLGLLGGVVIARGLASFFVRLPGVYLAFGTIGLGFVVEGLARAFPAVTGGASGLVLAPGRAVDGTVWYIVSVVALMLGLLAFVLVRRGASWRRMRTIRHDELVAAVVGIDVRRRKAQVFTIGCLYACIAGTLLAYFVGVVVPEDAGAQRSLSQIGMVIMGGPGLVFGPVVGAFVVSWLFFAAGAAAQYQGLIYGLCFLLAILYAKNGLLGFLPQAAMPRLNARPTPTPATGVTRNEVPSRSDMRKGRCLAVDGIVQRFGGLTALDDVSFDVAFGEVFALIGPNGAGKSTLFNVVSGLIAPTAGRVRLEGDDITAMPIEKRAPRIGRAFQVARLIPELSAVENVMVRLDQIAPALNEEQRRAAAMAQLSTFDLEAHAAVPVSSLSIGQHKLIDLARASVGNPSLVLLDEPAVGLTEVELAHLARLIRRLQDRGVAVVIVEHNIEFVSAVASRGIVLDGGRMIGAGPIDEIFADPRVQAAYFGALT